MKQSLSRIPGPLLACLLAAHAGAQQPAADPQAKTEPPARPDQVQPRMPLIPRTPARSEWTVRHSHEMDDPGQSMADAPEAAQAIGEMRKVNSIRFSKDDRLQTYRLRTRWTDGESEDEWIVMGFHVAERAGGRGLYIVQNEATTARDLKSTDFPELAWLDMKYYRGLKTYKGKQVFAFNVKFEDKPLNGNESHLMALARNHDPSATPVKVFKPKVSEVSVYLDAVTQLPVLYNDGNVLRRYSLRQPGSSDSLRPPNRILNFIRKRNAALTNRLTPPAGPGVRDAD